MPPTISIVTVVLNDRDGFELTAGSIAAQRSRDFEWIVVDGGSTDGTVDAIRCHEARIAAWRSAPDQGVYDAMNRGLALAQGAFVVFMNAGDQFAEPETLARVAAVLEGSAVDLLFGGTILALPQGRRVYRPPHPAQARIRYGLPAYHQATFVRRELHRQVPHDLDYRISSDYYTIAKMCGAGARTLGIDAPLAIQDFGPDNLSQRETLARLRDFVRIQRRVLAKRWVEIAVNTARLIGVHVAYRVLCQRHAGTLGWRLLKPLGIRVEA